MPPPSPTAASAVRVRSDGGVLLTLTTDWHAAFADEHLTAFVADDPAASARGFAPTCLLAEQPGHLAIDTWWHGVLAFTDGALLLANDVLDDGFTVTYALVSDGRSLAGHLRARWVPGRTVTVLVQFPAAGLEDWLPRAERIVASLDVEGLP